jgi:hypoxia up-regulated 1
LKEFFGGGSSTSEEATDSVENIPPRDPETPSSSSSDVAPSSSPSAEPTEVKKAVAKQDTIPLNTTVRFSAIPPMTVDEKKTARSRSVNFSCLVSSPLMSLYRLRVLDSEEAARNRRDEARNTLESYLYRLRDLIDNDNDDTPFRKCSKESERHAISEKLEGSFIWLHDKGDAADTTQLLDKRIALE